MMLICGLDEAGRGPLAGPLVAVAVLIQEDQTVDAIDSKKLSFKRRMRWADDLKNVLEYEVEIITVEEINRFGIGWANKEIFQRLIRKIDADHYIVDGNLKLADLGEKQKITICQIRADEHVPVVSAASILAKTIRDKMMLEYHEQFPVYRWDHNKGYPTPEHIRALKTFGGTPYHRWQYVKTVENRNYADYAQPLLLLPPNIN